MNKAYTLFILLVFQAIIGGSPACAARGGLVADTGTYTGDFDMMRSRGVIRVAVPFSRTFYFHDKGKQRGLTADALHDLEIRLARKYPGKRHLTFVITPMTSDRLLAALVQGKADIAAGNITVTAQLRLAVDVTAPVTDPMNEIVVTGPGAPVLASLDDLSGKRVHVRAATSYHQSLEALNQRFIREGKAPVNIVWLPEDLQDEDELDMLNAGLIQIVIKDDRLAALWKPSLPRIVLRPDLVVRHDAVIAWAIRKNSPKLKAALDPIIANATRKGLQPALYAQFELNAKQMNKARGDEGKRRFEELSALFGKYGARYGFDGRLLMAQGCQESGLDQQAISPAGAIGVMQIMPATAKTLAVGDIQKVESYIHGGAKYLAWLMDAHFKDDSLDETNRTLFAFASYNVGADRINALRKMADKQGLNPDVWFDNVELIAARELGQGPVRYVRGIFNSYVTYKLTDTYLASRADAIRRER